MINIEWNQVLPLIALVGLLSGIGILYVRSKLDGVFAKSDEVTDLRVAVEGRMETIERKLATMPDHADVRALGHRMSDVERNVAVVSTKLDAMVNGIGKIDRMVDLLVQNQMKKESEK